MQATSMTSLATVAPGTFYLSLHSGIRPFPCPPFPLQPRLRHQQPPSPARVPSTTQNRYLFPQRLAVWDECRHLPAIAIAALRHGVLAAWTAQARAPGMIGGRAEGCGTALAGVRSARRPRRECAELSRARRRRRWRSRCPAPRPLLTPPSRHRRRRRQRLVPRALPQPPRIPGWANRLLGPPPAALALATLGESLLSRA